jgi:hypothetical protein
MFSYLRDYGGQAELELKERRGLELEIALD